MGGCRTTGHARRRFGPPGRWTPHRRRWGEGGSVGMPPRNIVSAFLNVRPKLRHETTAVSQPTHRSSPSSTRRPVGQPWPGIARRHSLLTSQPSPHLLYKKRPDPKGRDRAARKSVLTIRLPVAGHPYHGRLCESLEAGLVLLVTQPFSLGFTVRPGPPRGQPTARSSR